MRSALFTCVVLSAPAVLACCPTFPISYTVPGVVAGTSDGTGYSVRVNVRYELELLGRHFFPEWAGRELHRIPCTSGEAHRADFRDTCGLEEAVVAQLLRRGDGTVDRLHWLPLAAAVRGSDRIEKALVDDADWLRVGDRWRTLRSEVRDIVASDPLAVETLVSLCGEQILPEDLRDAAPILCADRRAWAALEAGDLDRGRRLLSLAPTNSLVRLFWEARLARIDGDLGRSAELLRRWLAEAVARGGAPRGVFEIPVWENGWLFDGDGEYVYRTRSIERVVEGELGTVLLTEGDFEEALLAFLRARSWIVPVQAVPEGGRTRLPGALPRVRPSDCPHRARGALVPVGGGGTVLRAPRKGSPRHLRPLFPALARRPAKPLRTIGRAGLSCTALFGRGVRV